MPLVDHYSDYCRSLLVDLGIWVVRKDLVFLSQHSYCFIQVFFGLQDYFNETFCAFIAF